MNEAMLELLADVTTRVQRDIRTGACPAIVILDGQPRLIMTDYDYLRDSATAEAFELRAAAKARATGASRWILGVPLVWQAITAGKIVGRVPSHHPLREGVRSRSKSPSARSVTGRLSTTSSSARRSVSS